MTVGVSGSPTGQWLGLYYYNTWNGADGRLNPDGTERFNNYSMFKEKYTVVRNKTYDTYCAGSSLLPARWTNNDFLNLQSKLIEAVKGHDFNAGVALGTANQTLRLLSDTALRFVSSIRALKRGDIPKALAHLGVSPRRQHKRRRPPPANQSDLASLWLELQYGWKPLFKDMFEAAKAMEKSISSKPRRARIRVNSKKEYTVDYSNQNPYHSESTQVEKGMLMVELLEQLSTPHALGLFDPASVAWELQPFSFIFDWFIPIGTYLAAINQIPAINGRFIYTTSKWCYTTCWGTPGPPGSQNSYYLDCSTFQDTYTLSRECTLSLKVPKPEFKPLDLALSTAHLKNALALLVVLVTGNKR